MNLLKELTYFVVGLFTFTKLLNSGYCGFEAFVGAVCFGFVSVELGIMFIQAIRENYKL